jgi:GT2 family glycosyltransferase
LVDVVIVNWNSRGLLRECLAALDQSSIAERLNVVVVDNHSTDGSADGLAGARMRLNLVRNADNRGYAAACNQGAASGSAPMILFLNPDVRVRPEALQHTVGYLDDPRHRDVGIVGVQLLSPGGRIERGCARAPSAGSLLAHTLFLDRLFPALVSPHFMTTWDHGETREVDQVSGAYVMIRRELFDRVGGFDERFFLYYEDVDLCRIVRQAGSSIVYIATAAAEHTGGGTTAAIKFRRAAHLITSRLKYAGKHHGVALTTALMVSTMLVEVPVRCAYSGLRKLIEAVSRRQ